MYSQNNLNLSRPSLSCYAMLAVLRYSVRRNRYDRLRERQAERRWRKDTWTHRNTLYVSVLQLSLYVQIEKLLILTVFMYITGEVYFTEREENLPTLRWLSLSCFQS